jgi:hypothetical protein
VPSCRDTRVRTDGGHVPALPARRGVDNVCAVATRGLPLPALFAWKHPKPHRVRNCVGVFRLQASDFGVVFQWLERLLNVHPADVVVLSRVGCVLLQVRAEYAVRYIS